MTPSGSAPTASAPAADSVSGMVDRVTFQNPENGFCVLRVRARGHRAPVAVIGHAPDMTPGEWIEAAGRWEISPRHGRQFRADTLAASRPDTLEGIERYLGSGLIRGIGPHFARRLVAKFGAEVFEIMETRSARLLEVPGIGPGRRDRIREAWQEQKRVREIMAFLFSHGVSAARAHRIFKAYGDRAIEWVRLDPYRLARDIRGIGFETADRIARRLGIAADSELRARAGVEHELLQRTGEGHCACPRRRLVGQAAAALQMPERTLEAAVDHGLCEGRLVARPGPEGDSWIYLAPFDAAETEVARRVARLAEGSAPLAGVEADRALAWVEARIGFPLDEAQRDAVRESLRCKVAVITGGPGVGKTTLLRAIVEIHRAKRLRVRLCAPTGRAAKRLSESAGLPAQTIHRMLRFDPAAGGFLHGPNRPLGGDLFVVDEASMLDLLLAQSLLRAIPDSAALLWVGDADQLPSVGPGTVLRDLIACGRIPVCRLSRVFRQAARSRIVRNAHRINRGEMPEFPPPGAEPDGDFLFVEADEPDRAVRAILELLRGTVPKRFGFHPLDDIQVLTPMQRGELGARNLNAVLQRAWNPAGPSIERFGVVYRAGDKVMQTENDYDKDVFNGDIGRLVRVDEEAREAVAEFDGRRVVYRAHELDELALSYAMTIHKSQGSEYPCVLVPIHTQHYVMLRRNLLYTAVTRGRRLVVLVGSPKAVAIAVRAGEARRRITSLGDRLRDAFGAPGPAGA